MESFRQLKLSRWRQFDDLDLDLSGNLSVLTGPNGCGKTTVLNVLGRHFGWNLQFLTASFLSENDKKKFYADAWEAIADPVLGRSNRIGCVTYASGATSYLATPTHEYTQYQLQYENQRPVVGLHIPSHRPPPGYHRLQEIPIDPKTTQQHYQEFQNYLFATYEQSQQMNPAAAMKKALIALAVFGEGNTFVQSNVDYANVFHGFQDILRLLLPENIGFQSIEIRTPDVVLKTKSGDFPLESMSGGLNALFGIAWQIHMYGHDKEVCTVLIDEPENHLHPSMQREFLPRLSKAFPRYKFVVSSHSPFVVASDPSATVYALAYNENRRVVSKRLSEADLAGSPNKVLREVLDVQITMPIWVENRISTVLNKYSDTPVSEESIRQIRSELESEGLGSALGDFLVQRDSEPTSGPE